MYKEKHTNKALKEWSVVVDKLGEGKTILMIRRFKLCSCKEFLLYPTFNYEEEDLQKKYIEFSKKSLKRKSDIINIEFFAKVVDVIKVESGAKYGLIRDYYLWKPENVVRYDKSYTWILRVFKLKKPLKIKRQRGMSFVRLSKFASLNNKYPVLEDKKFNERVNSIKRILKD